MLYALKKMICQSSEQIADANKEIRVLTAVKHPNVIQLIASASTLNKNAQENYMLLFPLYEQSLQAIIDTGRGYPSCALTVGLDVVRILRQCVEGLSAVHAAGFRHAGWFVVFLCISVFHLLLSQRSVGNNHPQTILS